MFCFHEVESSQETGDCIQSEISFEGWQNFHNTWNNWNHGIQEKALESLKNVMMRYEKRSAYGKCCLR